MYQSTREHITKDARPDASKYVSKHASQNILSRPPLNISEKWGKIPHRNNSLCKQSGLIYKTMESLRSCLMTERGMNPSEDQWSALRDLVMTLEKMATGTAEPLYYLSPIDPGVGKTTAIIHFMKEMLNSYKHRDTSAIIFVDTIKQIRSLVAEFEAIGIDTLDYSVFISDTVDNHDLNSINPDRANARLLLTTQQMFESRCRGHNFFSDVREFQYKNSPREVKVWDEAMLPAMLLRADVTKILSMFDPLTRHDSETSKILQKLIKSIKSTEDGEGISIPDFNLNLEEARVLFEDSNNAIRRAVKDLCMMRGKEVIVKRMNKNTTILVHENYIPDDLKPLLITDASGRLRGTYKHWKEGRGDLVYLKDSKKRYSNLNVHLWQESGSKSAWKHPEIRDRLIEGIVQKINSKPDEDWLVIHHMKNVSIYNADIEALIRQKLSMNVQGNVKGTVKGTVHFAHWGGEGAKATNEYRDISNIILAGTLFFDEAHYETLLRCSRDLPVGAKTEDKHLQEIRLGEYGHQILQAACRGSVRQVGDSKNCNLYIIASKASGIQKLLRQQGETKEDGDSIIFPGCNLYRWNSTPSPKKQLKGRLGKAIDTILDFFSQDQKEVILKTADIARKLGINIRDFNKEIVKHHLFEPTLEEYGLQLIKQTGRSGSYISLMTDDLSKDSSVEECCRFD